MSTAPFCCYIPEENQDVVRAGGLTRDLVDALGCQEDATHTLTYGPGPEDQTEACEAHVGFLLGDGEVVVTPLEAQRLAPTSTKETTDG